MALAVVLQETDVHFVAVRLVPMAYGPLPQGLSSVPEVVLKASRKITDGRYETVEVRRSLGSTLAAMLH